MSELEIDAQDSTEPGADTPDVDASSDMAVGKGSPKGNVAVRTARKVAVGVVGGTVTATGIVLIPLPGPGTLITLGGLAILGTEFPAAKRLMNRAKDKAREVLNREG